MLEGKTRIPPVDIEALPGDLREVLEEQRKRYGAPLYPVRSADRRRRLSKTADYLRREGFNVSVRMNFGLSKKLVGLI